MRLELEQLQDSLPQPLVVRAGGVGTVLSGGSASGVSVPVIAGGAAVAGHGISMISNGAANLMTGNGQRQVNNSSNESTTGKRTKNRIPDKGEPNTTMTNKSGTTTKKYGPDGNVQKEFNKAHGGDNVPKNEKNDHIHDYKPMQENPNGKGERQPGRSPKKNELKKDFGL